MKINNLTVKVYEQEELDVYNFCIELLKKEHTVFLPLFDENNQLTNKKYPTTEIEYFFTSFEDKERGKYIQFNKGLLYFVEHLLKINNITYIKELQNNTETFSNNIADLTSTRYNLLDGITLKEEQWDAIITAIQHRRGIIQAGTGFGKTFVLCGICKALNELNDKPLTTLIIAPTLKIADQILDSFRRTKAGKVINWKDFGFISKGKITVACYSSLRTHIKKDSKILQNVDVLLCDEVHHFSNNTCQSIYNVLINTSFFIGVSASAIEQSRVHSTDIDEFKSSEIKTIASFGKVIWEIPAKDLVEKGQLCKPLLQIVERQITDGVPLGKENNWTYIQRNILMSNKRCQCIVDVINFHLSRGLKIVCLVNNHNWARKLAKMLAKPDITGILFGSNVSEIVSSDLKKTRVTSQNLYRQFENGKRQILFATNFFFEGADVTSIQVVMNCISGRNEKRVIQMTGRGLRLHHSKDYVIVVDFNDKGNTTLERQFEKRSKVYKNSLGISSEDILYINEEQLRQDKERRKEKCQNQNTKTTPCISKK